MKEVKVVVSHEEKSFVESMEHIVNNYEVEDIHYSKSDMHFTALIILRGQNERRTATRSIVSDSHNKTTKKRRRSKKKDAGQST